VFRNSCSCRFTAASTHAIFVVNNGPNVSDDPSRVIGPLNRLHPPDPSTRPESNVQPKPRTTREVRAHGGLTIEFHQPPLAAGEDSGFRAAAQRRTRKHESAPDRRDGEARCQPHM
jgi:hypothetical protein